MNERFALVVDEDHDRPVLLPAVLVDRTHDRVVLLVARSAILAHHAFQLSDLGDGQLQIVGPRGCSPGKHSCTRADTRARSGGVLFGVALFSCQPLLTALFAADSGVVLLEGLRHTPYARPVRRGLAGHSLALPRTGQHGIGDGLRSVARPDRTIEHTLTLGDDPGSALLLAAVLGRRLATIGLRGNRSGRLAKRSAALDDLQPFAGLTLALLAHLALYVLVDLANVLRGFLLFALLARNLLGQATRVAGWRSDCRFP